MYYKFEQHLLNGAQWSKNDEVFTLYYDNLTEIYFRHSFPHLYVILD